MRGLGATCLLVMEVEVVLRSERPPRHQQPAVRGDDRVGVDDAQVHACHPVRVQSVRLGRQFGGDRQPQSPTVGEESDCPDLLGWVGNRASEAHP
jgi:hypothetical protein